MNVQSPEMPQSNAEIKFKDFDPLLHEIHANVDKSQSHFAEYEKALFEALGKTLDLGRLFAQLHEADKSWAQLKDFLDYHKFRWNGKNEANFFHSLAELALDRGDKATGKGCVSPATLSRYRSILRYAYLRGMDGAALSKMLHEKTLTGVYELAVDLSKFDPETQYVEDDGMRFQRASKELLQTQDLPKVAFTQTLPAPEATADGFAVALVHVDGNQFKVLRFLDDDLDETKAIVRGLVPSEAKRKRQKLTEKSFYWLFVATEIFTRFLPSFAEMMSWERAQAIAALPVVHAATAANDIAALVQASDAQRAQKAKQNLQRFVLLNALRFHHDGRTWHATSITTHPSTPIASITLGEYKCNPFFPLLFSLRDIPASRFVADFLQHPEWRMVKRQGFVAVAASDKSVKPLLFEPIDHAALWRGLDPQLVVVAKLTISAVHLADLVQWRIDHAETPVLGRRKPFPGTLRFEVADQHAELVFPADPKSRRTMGVMTSIPNPLDLTQRYLDFATIAKLVQFARDYAVTYEAEVLHGPQGASAIRFNFIGLQYPASITLPLLLSLQGDPMEITSPFANQSDTPTTAQAIESAIESTETETTNGAPKNV